MMSSPRCIKETGVRSLVAIAVVVAATGCDKPAPARVPMTPGMLLDEGALSLFSRDNRTAYRLSVDSGSTVASNQIKHALYDAWLYDGVVYGTMAPEYGTPYMVGVGVQNSEQKWQLTDAGVGSVTWVGPAFVLAGGRVIHREHGTIAANSVVVLPTASPDMVVTCDGSGRSSALNPLTTNVFWQQGSCDGGLAVERTRGARVSEKHLTVFELTTGATVREMELTEPLLPVKGPSDFGSLAIDGERVYAATPSSVVAFAIADGSALWKVDGAGAIVADGGFVAIRSGFMVNVVDGSGKSVLRVELDGEPAAGVRAVMSGGKLFLRTDEEVLAYDLATKQRIWSRDIDG